MFQFCGIFAAVADKKYGVGDGFTYDPQKLEFHHCRIKPDRGKQKHGEWKIRRVFGCLVMVINHLIHLGVWGNLGFVCGIHTFR